MKAKNVNLLFAFVAILLSFFSYFCISKMNQTSNQLINCRNHVSEFKKNMLRLKNESQNLVQVLNQMKYEIAQIANASGDFLERKVSRLSESEIRPNGFEGLKFFLPHLRAVERIYPDVATSRGKVGVSFALGITTVDRRNHTYLKQTLTSVLSRMTPEEEKDSVVIISVADTGDYLNYVVDMVKTNLHCPRFSAPLDAEISCNLQLPLLHATPIYASKIQKTSAIWVLGSHFNTHLFLSEWITGQENNGGLKKTVMSRNTAKEAGEPGSGAHGSWNLLPAFHALIILDSWQMKQALDFCVLMLYARPKATYYLQLEDDIIARKTYFTKMKDFVNSLTSENWFYIEFSVLGFIGKLFHSKDLLDFVHFFLMFYKVKPIDMLLDDIFLVKMCHWGEHIRSCMQRRKEVRVQYRPSLFQHVGIHSSFPGRKQHLKDFPKSHNFFKNYQTHFWGKGTARIRFSQIILDKRLRYTILN